MYLMPGFVDTHVHYGDAKKAPDAEYVNKLWLASGVTTGTPAPTSSTTLPEPEVPPVSQTFPAPSTAIRRGDLQIEIVVDVAVRAGGHLARRSHLVRVRQWKTGGRVVKIRRQPGNRIMASGAGCNRKHRGRRRMLGVRRLLPRCKMASGISAIRRCDFQVVVAAHVAI